MTEDASTGIPKPGELAIITWPDGEVQRVTILDVYQINHPTTGQPMSGAQVELENGQSIDLTTADVKFSPPPLDEAAQASPMPAKIPENLEQAEARICMVASGAQTHSVNDSPRSDVPRPFIAIFNRMVLPVVGYLIAAVVVLVVMLVLAIIGSVVDKYLGPKNEVFYRNELVRGMRAWRDDPESFESITATVRSARERGYEFSQNDLVEIFLGVNLPSICRETLRYDDQGNAVLGAQYRASLERLKLGTASSCEERATKLLREGLPMLREISPQVPTGKEAR